MSRLTFAIIGMLVVAFGFGFAAGSFTTGPVAVAAGPAGGNGGNGSSGESSGSAIADNVQRNTLLSSRIRELEKALAAQKDEEKAVLDKRLAFFLKYRNKGVYVSGFDSFSPKGVKLNDAMADLLELSESERRSVEQHLTQAKDAMITLQDANATIVKQTANSVTYEMPPDPKGKEVQKQLNDELTNDVGDDRAKFLIDSGDFGSSMSSFANFAQSKTDVNVTWSTNAAGKPLYTWKMTVGGASSWNDTPSEYVPDSIKKYLPTTDPQ